MKVRPAKSHLKYTKAPPDQPSRIHVIFLSIPCKRVFFTSYLFIATVKAIGRRISGEFTAQGHPLLGLFPAGSCCPFLWRSPHVPCNSRHHGSTLQRGLVPYFSLHTTHTEPWWKECREMQSSSSNFRGLWTQEIFAKLQCLKIGNSTLIMPHCDCDVLGDGAGRPQSEYNAPICDSNDWWCSAVGSNFEITENDDKEYCFCLFASEELYV